MFWRLSTPIKGSALVASWDQALLTDPAHQPVGHFSLDVDGGQRLHKGLAAGLAPPTAGVHVDRKTLAVGRQVTDDLLIATVADQAVRPAGRADARRVRDFGVDVIDVVGFHDPLHLEVGEVQDIRGHGTMNDACAVPQSSGKGATTRRPAASRPSDTRSRRRSRHRGQVVRYWLAARQSRPSSRRPSR